MKKLVIISTHGPDNAEKAILPFVAATAAQSLGTEVNIISQSNCVEIVSKGGAEKVQAEHFPNLKELLDLFIEQGGKLLVCSPCMKARCMTEEDLIDGATIVSAGTVIKEVDEADKVLVY
ncbi:sulfur reduction protein DsrE [bacterium]|nr:MAG: sulfur reduction protein DsrE [bacterium]